MNSPTNTSELRLSNRHSIAMEVYQKRFVSKQEIVYDLNISLPTVTQNLRELEAFGLVERSGQYKSTGGRKAQMYRFVADAKISIGVILLKELYTVVAIDLYGETLCREEIHIPFSNHPEYFQQLGMRIHNFVKKNQLVRSRILGVCVALQGLVSPDKTEVVYSEILNCKGLTLKEISANIDFPCSMVHDSYASAEAEVWAQKDICNAALIFLTRYLGGALIVDGNICDGNQLSCVIEHMRLYPNGNKCYCGKYGCLETYCSAYALERDAGEPLDCFFTGLRNGDARREVIWKTFLHNLAIAINNIRMLVDCEFIIGGYLLNFMTEQDFQMLKKYVDAECPFDFAKVKIRRSVFTDDAAASGAALSLVKEYLKHV